jgi:hypothetical protein
VGEGAVHEAQGAAVRAAHAYPPGLGGQEQIGGVLAISAGAAAASAARRRLDCIE